MVSAFSSKLVRVYRLPFSSLSITKVWIWAFLARIRAYASLLLLTTQAISIGKAPSCIWSIKTCKLLPLPETKTAILSFFIAIQRLHQA